MFSMNTRFTATQLCKNVIALEFALLECFIDTKKKITKLAGINPKTYGSSCLNPTLTHWKSQIGMRDVEIRKH